jgi:hypothetical protein
VTTKGQLLLLLLLRLHLLTLPRTGGVPLLSEDYHPILNTTLSANLPLGASAR